MVEGRRHLEQLARFLKQLDDPLLGAEDGLACELRVGGGAGIRFDRIRGVCDHAAVETQDRADRQIELAPPHHVGHVTERADHRDSRALVLLREVVREHGDLDVEQGGAHRLAEVGLVALIVGVSHQRDTGREQFGTRRLDVDVARAVGLVEGDAVVRGLLIAIFELCLGDGGAEVDIPQRGRERLVRLAALVVADEPELALADRLV